MTKFLFPREHAPQFLRGTFHFKERGYHYAEPPQLDLLSNECLSSPDAWIVVASVLERAKRGDYSNVPLLKKWVPSELVSPTLIGACLDLLADAGNAEALDWIANAMMDEWGFTRIQLVQAAQWSGQLFLIPFIVETWKMVERRSDKDAIEVALSNLLEPLNEEPVIPSGISDSKQFETLVISKASALCEQYGTDRVAILGGEPVDLWKIIDRMRMALVNNKQRSRPDWSPFLLWRRKFETYTGVDCSSFYGDKGFMPLNAAAVLEEYVEHSPHAIFEPGKRYFFEHYVPY